MRLRRHLSVLAAHLLVVFLAVVGPVWDYFDTRSLKANPTSQSRLRYYQRTVLWLRELGRKYSNTMGEEYPDLITPEGMQALQRMGVQSSLVKKPQIPSATQPNQRPNQQPTQAQFQKFSSDGKWGWNGSQWVGTGR